MATASTVSSSNSAVTGTAGSRTEHGGQRDEPELISCCRLGAAGHHGEQSTPPYGAGTVGADLDRGAKVDPAAQEEPGRGGEGDRPVVSDCRVDQSRPVNGRDELGCHGHCLGLDQATSAKAQACQPPTQRVPTGQGMGSGANQAIDRRSNRVRRSSTGCEAGPDRVKGDGTPGRFRAPFEGLVPLGTSPVGAERVRVDTNLATGFDGRGPTAQDGFCSVPDGLQVAFGNGRSSG